MRSERQSIEAAVTLIRQAKRIIAFTGAGISTASGIPDFRSPTSGLWDHIDPMHVASQNAFRQNPLAFFQWIRPLLSNLTKAKPNSAHLALARLEQLGKLNALITQNIDGLHTRAGSSNVYELHGHLRTATCTYCFKKYDATPFIHDLQHHGIIPRCQCNRHGPVIKPDIILFGEQLPRNTVNNAKKAITTGDLLFIIGSSLHVAPANQIPLEAIKSGSRLIIINYEPTPADIYADVVIHQDVNMMLPAIVNELENNNE